MIYHRPPDGEAEIRKKEKTAGIPVPRGKTDAAAGFPGADCSADSPAISGGRVETANPDRLRYIGNIKLKKRGLCETAGVYSPTKCTPVSTSMEAMHARDSTRTPRARMRAPPG